MADGSDAMAAEPGQPRVNEAESPLAWLHSRTGADGRTLIHDAAILTGERFRRDVTQAAMLPSLTTNWSRMEAASSRASPARSGHGLGCRHRRPAAGSRGLSGFVLGHRQFRSQRLWLSRAASAG
jgi:hypothetical protein